MRPGDATLRKITLQPFWKRQRSFKQVIPENVTNTLALTIHCYLHDIMGKCEIRVPSWSTRAVKQNTTDCVAYKQQTFLSQGAGGWKFKVKVPADSVSGESPLPSS